MRLSFDSLLCDVNKIQLLHIKHEIVFSSKVLQIAASLSEFISVHHFVTLTMNYKG